MKETLKIVLLNAVILISIFYGFQTSFWFLNQQSSLANILGFLGTLTFLVIGFYWGKNIRHLLNKNK